VSRRGPAVAFAVLALALGVAALLLLPEAVPTGPVEPDRDFTAAQRAREEAFHAAARPWAYASLLLGLAVAAVLGLTPLGARLVRAVARPLGGGWVWQVVLGTLALTALERLVTLPLGVQREQVLREYGLSAQTWGTWAVDVVKGVGVGAALSALALLAVLGLARRLPRRWWAAAAAATAALVCAGSFAYPVVVEPVFNEFTPLEQGPLRTELLSLAERDGVPVQDVLVADASRRTTALNAYVSGFGSTRRIVVYDNLLEQSTPREVALVVAHELGHADDDDVLRGTLLGALGAAAGVCLLALLLSWAPLLRQAGVDGPGDGRATALLLLLVAAVTLLTSPAVNLFSRRVEARADLHALDLTHDPQTAIASQVRLATTNLSDLDPPWWVYGIFASHPTAPERIAAARTWEAR
jgi:STE24 endopeptidase